MLRRITIIRVTPETDGCVRAWVTVVARSRGRWVTLREVTVNALNLTELALACRGHLDPKDIVAVLVERHHALACTVDVPQTKRARALSGQSASEARLQSSVRQVSGDDPATAYWSVWAGHTGRTGILLQAAAHLCDAFTKALPEYRIQFRTPGLGWTPSRADFPSGQNAIVLWSGNPNGVSVSLFRGDTLVDLRLPRPAVNPEVVAGQVRRAIHFFGDSHGPVDGVVVVTDRPEEEVRVHISPSELRLLPEKFRVLSMRESPHVNDAVLQVVRGVPPLRRGGGLHHGRLFPTILRGRRGVAAVAGGFVGIVALVGTLLYWSNFPLPSRLNSLHEASLVHLDELRVERETRLAEVREGAFHAQSWSEALERTQAAASVFSALEEAMPGDTQILEVVLRGTEIRSVSGYSPAVAGFLENLRRSDFVRSPSLNGPVIEEVDPANPEHRRQRFSLRAEVATEPIPLATRLEVDSDEP